MDVNIALPVPTPQVFTYRVPPDLESLAAVGVRAFVPFGSVKKTGVIVGFSESEALSGTKEIIELLDPEPLFDDDSLRFYRWVADYYVTPLGKFLGEILPGGKRQTMRYVRLLPSAHLNTYTPSSGLEEQVMAKLQSSPQGYAVGALRKQFGRLEIELILRHLMRRALVEVTDRVSGQSVKEKREIILSLGSHLSQLQWTPRQERVVAILKETGPLPLSQLLRRSRVKRDLINRMVAKGILKIEEKTVLRTSSTLPVIPPDQETVTLTDEQQVAVNRILQALETGNFSSFLLHGVTGSGKTEVYLQTMAQVLHRGEAVLYLVPEIALTSQLLGRLRARFPEERIAVLHSGIPDSVRYDEWRAIRRGEVRLVCGARSAIFAPIDKLRLIVVDEEHDESYKQEEKTPYHGRDMALVKGQMTGAAVILGSATPAIQTYYRAYTGRHTLLSLPRRVEDRPLPPIELVDMRQDPTEDEILSRALRQAIAETLAQGKQVMLFLNRRGFFPVLICRACGRSVTCPHCELALTLHRDPERLLCHYCDYSCRPPLSCPHCGESRVMGYGMGTERVAELVTRSFPGARISRMDRDAAMHPRRRGEILQSLSRRNLDILIGTQMIAKGHDFPDIALIGILAADTALHLPDFRASERTFQLLTQMAGRGGRGDTPGRVIIQTFNPEHYVMKHVQRYDYESFYGEEIAYRQSLRYPPFSRLLCIHVASTENKRAEEEAKNIRADILTYATSAQVEVLGPAPAPLSRLRGRYRWQIMVKTPRLSLQHAIAKQISFRRAPRGTIVRVDVDPLHFM